ncbi:unnamed protein product [Calypogeia fissa]
MFVPRAVRKRSAALGPSSSLSSLSPALDLPSNSSSKTLNSASTPVLQSAPALGPPPSSGSKPGPIPSFSTTQSVALSSNSSPSLQIASVSGSAAPGPSCGSSIAGLPPLSVCHARNQRSVSVLSSDGGYTVSSTDLHGGNPSGDEDNPVKVRSIDQRAAKPDEPSCVVCGRYGEYICDETDEDVCSLECKSVVLKRVSNSTRAEAPVERPSQEADGARQNSKVVLHHKDSLLCMKDEVEEIIVRDGVKSLPEWEPDRVIKKLTPQQVNALRKQIEISVQGDDIPRPILEFSNCKLLPKLQANLETAGYETPTPVQMQVIPAALKGRDMLVSAGTGSGKTVGYLLSTVFRICLIRSHYQFEPRKPLAIVLTPTRELSVQVEQQAKELAKGLQFKTALVVGGDAMPQQLYRINQGVELIVGTPGRLVDLLAKHDVELDNICMLVLDEVDCMLERGFRDQVLQIQTALSQPQILMFSATIPPEIEKFTTSILRRPLLISVGKTSLPSEAVKQTVLWVENNQKKKKLFDIIRSPHHFHPPVVVFVNSRAGADLLSESIQSVTGLQAAAIHGEKPMQERRQVLKDFLMGSLPIVVATGVLGRGLDLLRVTQVIVFDMPHSAQEYIHQIGRASRLGVPGSAMVFINNDSKVLFKDLVELFKKSGVVVPKELSNSPYAASSYAAAYNPRKRKAHHTDKRG